MKVDRTKMIEALRRVVQRMHYPLEVMLVGSVAVTRCGGGLPNSATGQMTLPLESVPHNRVTN